MLSCFYALLVIETAALCEQLLGAAPKKKDRRAGRLERS